MIIKLNITNFIFEILIFFGMLISVKGDSLIGKIIVISVLCIYFFVQMLKSCYSLYDLLFLISAGLLMGANYLLYVGIMVNTIYLLMGMKKGWDFRLDLELIGFSIMFIAGGISSILNAIDSESAFFYVLVYFMILLFIYEMKIISRKVIIQENAMIRKYVVSVFMLGIGFYMTHTFPELMSLSRSNIYYNSLNGVGSNTLAGIIAPFFLGLILVVVEANDTVSRVLASISLILLAPILLAIQSRGAYLGLFVAIMWIFFRGKSKRTTGVLTIVVVISIIFLLNNQEFILDFFGRFLTVVERTGSQLNGREVLYYKAWNLFLYHPFIGNGFWQFYAYTQIWDPHNFVLTYLAYTGIIGMSGFIIYLFATFKRILTAFNKKKINSVLLSEIVIVSFITVCVHAMVEPALTTYGPLSIFCFLVLLPVRVREKEE